MSSGEIYAEYADTERLEVSHIITLNFILYPAALNHAARAIHSVQDAVTNISFILYFQAKENLSPTTKLMSFIEDRPSYFILTMK